MALINHLKSDYPKLNFVADNSFYWSPENGEIHYAAGFNTLSESSVLLHETAHALLGHLGFTNDFVLLESEVSAWDKAYKLAKNYGIPIDKDYAEQCLDTYRNWLYQRSSCPRCCVASLQADISLKYLCYNCSYSWSVSRERFCRPYRRHVSNQKVQAL